MNLRQISEPAEMALLIAFFDLTHFSRWSASRTSRELFDILDEYFEFVGDVVAEGGGTVVKFIGDAGLLAYPEECVDAGVRSLIRLRNDGDVWLRNHEIPCRNVIKANFGTVTCGAVGTRDGKVFDVYGNAVNTAALLKSDGMAITPQVFQKLRPETRQLFEEHAPTSAYVLIEQQDEV